MTERVVYFWPDGSWCDKGQLEQCLTWKSDDFGKITFSWSIDDDEVDKLVQKVISDV